jgi:hypothetical protein
MKENLFRLIRKEELVLWAGAGLSIYAGYPSGSKLIEMILQKLKEEERKLIDATLSLENITEEIFRIQGDNKKGLIQILNEIFINTPPSSTKYHDKLKLIPHFKTIVTTNYDRLFEHSFESNIQPVIEDNQVPYLERGRTHLFKIHGDLSKPDSIVITKSDYNMFFQEKTEDSIVWSVIKERMATNSVLFLGYNLEDPNVLTVFDRITSILTSNRKECFLISPNLPSHKISHLRKKSIQYINATAEEIIDEILLNIKENIIGDFENGITSPETFRKFLSNYDLLPELKTKGTNFTLSSLKGKHNQVQGEFIVTLKKDNDFISEFSDYVSGRKIGTFTVSEEQLLNANIWYGGLKIPNSEKVAKVEFKTLPQIATTIDLKFDSGFEINNIIVKVFKSSSIIEFRLELVNCSLKLNLDISALPKTKFRFDYIHNEVCKNLKEEIELFTLINKLSKGEKFTVYPTNGESFSKDIPAMDSLLDYSEVFLNYFSQLKHIETHYKLRFQNFAFNSISEQTRDKVKILISKIMKQSIPYDWDSELKMDFINKEKAKETAEQLSGSEVPIVAHHRKDEIMELHGCKINLGFKRVEFEQPYVLNLETILEGNENVVRIGSRNKKVQISYTDDLI